MADRCVECGIVLTLDERAYYEHRCEVCEGESMGHASLTDDPRALRAIRLAQLTERAVEAAAALSGLLGAYLLAAKGEHAAWGWAAFLASNFGFIAIGWRRRLWWLMAMQIGFTYTSMLGISRWLL